MSREYRRVHRLTPLLRFWTLILAVIAAVAVNINTSTYATIWGLVSGEGGVAVIPVLLSLGVFVLACVLIWLVSQIWWKAMGFRLTEEEVELKHGVFNTQLRTARYDRIQAVDLVESVIARIFRVAAVRVETAGGTGSVIEIAYLGRSEAEQLRRELIDATHRRIPPAAAAAEGEAAAEAAAVAGGTAAVGVEKQQVVVPEIPIARTLASAALSLSTVVLVIFILIVLLTPLGVAFVIPLIVGFIPAVWNLVDKSWKFSAVLQQDVLNVSYGLADRRRQSIPLDRIHGVTLIQPLLWRRLGWWRVSVTVAGYGVETKQGGTTKILPVGSRELALSLLELVGPLTGGEIERSADPARMNHPGFTSPPAARWVSPIDRTRQGVTLVGTHAVIVHSGRFHPRMSVIHPSHIQELTLRQGPVQRKLGLCTVKFDLVPGPVSMSGEDLSSADGRELLTVLRRRHLPALVSAPET
ncbi:PH domain-containing protein [Corynebacterium pacaense]|uniref:PH domain-containing protein n=1 Tax=Corynebacterium pacaense TaxID=1816684 RepID=UPI0011779F36|nr:PH domain-containing protein [Corynebacterium pacaense]